MTDKRLNVRIDPEWHRRLKVACAEARLDMSDVVLILVKDWVKEHEAERRQIERGKEVFKVAGAS